MPSGRSSVHAPAATVVFDPGAIKGQRVIYRTTPFDLPPFHVAGLVSLSRSPGYPAAQKFTLQSATVTVRDTGGTAIEFSILVDEVVQVTETVSAAGLTVFAEAIVVEPGQVVVLEITDQGTGNLADFLVVLRADPYTTPPPPPCTLYVTALGALNPTAWWPLDETSGTVAADITGHGHDGTYQSGVRLADRVGPCGEGYVGIPRVTSSPAVIVPDDSAWSVPNDLTLVYAVSFVDAFAGGSTLAGMSALLKVNEWYATSATQDLSVVELDAAASAAYREWFHASGLLLGPNLHLVVVRMPFGGAISVAIDGTDPFTPGLTSGPTGTRAANGTGVLWLGMAAGTMAAIDATHGRFLSNAAVFNTILTTGEVAGLWSAFHTDGWDAV